MSFTLYIKKHGLQFERGCTQGAKEAAAFINALKPTHFEVSADSWFRITFYDIDGDKVVELRNNSTASSPTSIYIDMDGIIMLMDSAASSNGHIIQILEVEELPLPPMTPEHREKFENAVSALLSEEECLHHKLALETLANRLDSLTAKP